MLVDAYGSDSGDNNSGDEHTSRSRSPPQRNKSTSHSLPPSHPSASGSSSLNLPTPKAKRAPKKIAIDLPALPKDNFPDDSEDARPAKKPRTDSRGTGSALFSKLPAPKMSALVKAPPERILGSGKGPGLVFNNAPPQKSQDTSITSSNVDLQDSPEVTEVEQSALSLPFTPLSVRKGKANVSLEGPSSEKAPDSSSTSGADMFSLGVSYHFLIHLRHQTFHPRLCKASFRLYNPKRNH